MTKEGPRPRLCSKPWGQTERIREVFETFLCVHAARPKHNIWQKTKRSAWFGLRLKMFGIVLFMNQCNASTMIKHWIYKTQKKLPKMYALYAKSSQENYYLLILKLFQALFLSSVEHKRRYFKKGFSLSALKIKVLYWHLWLQKEPLTSMEPCHSTKGSL